MKNMQGAASQMRDFSSTMNRSSLQTCRPRPLMPDRFRMPCGNSLYTQEVQQRASLTVQHHASACVGYRLADPQERRIIKHHAWVGLVEFEGTTTCHEHRRDFR